jgi:hypothetical protein
MKSLGLPLGAYNVAWAVVTIWMAKVTAGHSVVWQPVGHPRVGSGFLSMDDLKGQTHNQPIKWSLLGYL